MREDDIVIHVHSDRHPKIREVFDNAYHHVLKPCFEEIGEPIHPRVIEDLLAAHTIRPQSHFYLITASRNHQVIGASCVLVHDDLKSAYWIYDGVRRDCRKEGIANKMHDYWKAQCEAHFKGKDYRLWLELTHDKKLLDLKLANLQARQLNFDYTDAGGDKTWRLSLVENPPRDQVPVAEVLAFIEANRMIVLQSPPREDDTVMAANKKALENQATEGCVDTWPLQNKSRVKDILLRLEQNNTKAARSA